MVGPRGRADPAQVFKRVRPLCMPRPPRIAFNGAIYHVTIHGNNDETVFRDDQDDRTYLHLLTRMLRRRAISLLAYGLMTNHIHLVVRTPQANISVAMQWLHGCYAAAFNRRHRRRGHLFGDRFFTSVVDSDEYLLESTRYIHLNPVRAGLVQRPEDYRWTSYPRYIGGNEELVPVEPDLVLKLLSKNPQRRESLYQRFIEDGLTGLWTPKQEGVSRIAIAAAAVLDAGGMPRAALCRQTPRNRTRTLLMGVLRGVEGLSTAEIAGYVGVKPRAVMTAAWRLSRDANRNPQMAERVATMRAAAGAALKAVADGTS